MTAVAGYMSIGIQKSADSEKIFNIERDLIFYSINLESIRWSKS